MDGRKGGVVAMGGVGGIEAMVAEALVLGDGDTALLERPCVGSCEVSMDALLTGYWPAASPNSHSWVTTVHWMSGCEQRRVCSI